MHAGPPPPPVNGAHVERDVACPTSPTPTPAVRLRLDLAAKALDAELDFLLGRTPAKGTPTRALRASVLTGTMLAFEGIDLEGEDHAS